MINYDFSFMPMGLSIAITFSSQHTSFHKYTIKILSRKCCIGKEFLSVLITCCAIQQSCIFKTLHICVVVVDHCAGGRLNLEIEIFYKFCHLWSF